MLLSSLEGLSRPTVNNKEHKEQRRKNKNNFPVCDCVHLLCSPECQVLEENKVSRSSLPPYSLSQIPCPPNTLLEHAGFRSSSIRKHLR